MTIVNTGNVALELAHPQPCEGCGELQEELYEDEGMNWLCRACMDLATSEDEGESPDDKR